jgi:aerobic carbon-monoxide dehydrogenase medium subunit
MKAPRFSYHDPRQVTEVIGLLSTLENAKLLAGGQSLMPMLNMRYVLPDHLIDLNRVEGLNVLAESESDLHVGAMVRQRDMEFSDSVQRRLPIINDALQWVGHRQTRNRGTVGGSLCHLDPAAELGTIAAVLDAELTVQGPDGQRTIGFKDFPLGFMMSCLSPQEMLTSVRFPVWPETHGWGFAEYARRHGDFAIVSAAAMVLRGADQRITRAAVALGGMGAVPVRAAEAEHLLLGSTGDEATLRAAADCCKRIEAVGDALVPASYRQHLAGVMVARALRQALSRAE